MHHVCLIKAGEVNRAAAFTYMNIRRLRQCIQQFMSGVSGENGRTAVITRLTAHRVVIGIDRIKTCVTVPGFVEVQTIGGFFQQILRVFGVIAYAVIGAVGYHAVRGFLPDFVFGQRAFADFLLQGFRLHFLRIDWPDNAVAVAAWHHVYRFRASQH